MFGDESDSDGELVLDKFAAVNDIFVEVMKLKIHLKVKLEESTDQYFTMNKKVAVLVDRKAVDQDILDHLLQKLNSVKCTNVDVYSITEFATLSPASSIDILVSIQDISEDLRNTSMDSSFLSRAFDCKICPGGSFFTIGDSLRDLFPDVGWSFEPIESIHSVAVRGGKTVFVAKKYYVRSNSGGCRYWKEDDSEEHVSVERKWLDLISVPISSVEREMGLLCDASHELAVENLLKYGLCILPGLFDKGEMLEWGSQSKADATKIFHKLMTTKNIDLLNPTAESNPFINNFYELSMREALRCDIRNGKGVRDKSNRLYAACKAAVLPSVLEPGPAGTITTVDSFDASAAAPLATRRFAVQRSSWSGGTRLSSIDSKVTVDPVELRTPASSEWGAVCRSVDPQKNLRYNPIVLPIISEVMNPPSELRMGNWGRWNFEGPGPSVAPTFKVGELGTVMSLPGCADQTIHADTAHMYVHTQLPPHYLNLFMPGCERDLPNTSGNVRGFDVGHTAFVIGSQHLEVCQRIMDGGDEDELKRRLVRPQLQAGDAFIFDCRVLHFGLSNQAKPSGSSICSSTAPSSPSEHHDDHSSNCKLFDDSYWRPMLYVNYHQNFFHDPKNWNDKEKLL